ncbi:MAG: LPS-assembly protein LptD [Bacteriovoracia bacterium]
MWACCKIICVTLLLINQLQAATPQFQLGDTLSIFSDRAFRKEGGDVFEAVGNVVVVNEKDTLYGESATFDRRTMIFKVDGNVRFITQDLTLYGSQLEYHAASGYAQVKNARIVHPQFNVVSRELYRRPGGLIEARDAEFTTCRDCTESWSVYGRKILIYLKERAEIYHGLAKIKGVSVLYLPYMVVPLSQRKSGLLFPRISSQNGVGLSLEQPVFWAIDEDKDATITPTFWAKRGYGTDLEYRQRFAPQRWFEGNGRFLNDTIYLPGKNDLSESGRNYTRYFGDVENHWYWNPNWSHHMRFTDTRDLDIVRDHPLYTDNRVNSSDFGFNGFVDGRGERWALSLQSEYSRNQLFADPEEFDRDYVQTLPRVSLGTTPFTLIQSDMPFLRHIYAGVDGSFTRFRRVENRESNPIRDADRFTAKPYLGWHLFNWGPLGVKTEATFDYQKYRFPEASSEFGAEKSATLLRTEASFTVDKIFGLAFEEKIPAQNLPKAYLKRMREKERSGPKPLTRAQKKTKLVGKLPPFESSLTNDGVMVARQAYRYSQEYKFIHHFITSETESGNPVFLNQIQENSGWFDYTDAVRSQEYLLGANITRTVIPPSNTLEFQWNNVLIRKSPKATDWRTDQRYLRDNFSYQKKGYFNVSQGYLFDQEFDDLRDKLTRLAVKAGYLAAKWSLSFSEYFFHRNSQHLFQMAWQREFDFLNLLTAYNYNSLEERRLNTLSAGIQVRPTDTIGLSYVRQVDLEARDDIRTVYALDIMPHNNCWILSLNYQESLVGFRYGFNVLFNFGDERFASYRRDWFRMQRMQ